MPTLKKGMPKVSPFAQMLRDKREKLAPGATLREFCASRGLDAPAIDGMERDRRTAPATYGALYKLAGGYGHSPTDRWTAQLLDAALGKAPPKAAAAKPRRQAAGGSSRVASSVRKTTRSSRRASPGVARNAASSAPKGASAAR